MNKRLHKYLQLSNSTSHKHYFISAVFKPLQDCYELWVGWGTIGKRPRHKLQSHVKTQAEAISWVEKRMSEKKRKGYVEEDWDELVGVQAPAFWPAETSLADAAIREAQARLASKKQLSMRRRNADWNF